MKQRLRVAAVGTGYFSQFHYDAWSRFEGVQLVGVADLNVEAAQAVAQQYGAQPFSDAAAMIEDVKPDLLDIITPPPTHFPLIALAAEHHIDVVCQKPFCGELAHAEKAVAVAEEAGINVTVHENFRFQPWYQKIKQVLETGQLGDLYQITFRLRPGDGQGADAYLERQPYFQKMERFLIHETAIHYVDVFRFLFGELVSVSAELQRFNPAIVGEDACLLSLQFQNGARGLIDGNRLSDHKAENTRRTMGEMLIEGSKGVLALNGDAELTFRAHGSIKLEILPFDWREHGFGGDCVYLFTQHVVNHYLHGEPLQNSAADYLTNLRAEEAIYEADKTGRRQALGVSAS